MLIKINGDPVEQHNTVGVIHRVKEFIQHGQVDRYNSGPDLFWNWIGEKLGEGLLFVWDWFILNLPDIMGYGTILAGVIIVLGAAIPRVGLMKPVAVYAMAMILALCLLAAA